MWLASCICLVFVGAVCLVGTLWRRYDDNLVQRCGMAVLCFGCAGRAGEIWHAQYVRADWLLVHVGMALIAAGVSWRVAQFEWHRRRTQP